MYTQFHAAFMHALFMHTWHACAHRCRVSESLVNSLHACMNTVTYTPIYIYVCECTHDSTQYSCVHYSCIHECSSQKVLWIHYMHVWIPWLCLCILVIGVVLFPWRGPLLTDIYSCILVICYWHLFMYACQQNGVISMDRVIALLTRHSWIESWYDMTRVIWFSTPYIDRVIYFFIP